MRELEGLAAAAGWLRGDGATELHDPRARLARSRVDVAQGHKTGFYLDQRDNRARFAQAVRHFGCARVLNCYCYTGGFTRRGAGRRRGAGDERRLVGAGARARAARMCR